MPTYDIDFEANGKRQRLSVEGDHPPTSAEATALILQALKNPPATPAPAAAAPGGLPPESITVDPATGNATMRINVERAAGDTPPPTAPARSPEASYLSWLPGFEFMHILSPAQQETVAEKAPEVAKQVAGVGISTGLSLGGAAVGGMVGGPPGALAGEMGGSLLGRKVNVALGLEEPGTVGDVVATVAPAALRVPGALARGGRALLEHTPPGQLLRHTEAKEAYLANRAAAKEAILDSRAQLQGELDRIQDLRTQAQDSLKAFDTQITEHLQAGKVAQAREVGAAKAQAKQTIATLDTQATQTRLTQQAHLDALQDAQQRETVALRQATTARKERAATEARTYLQKLPVPTDAEIHDLYTAVNQYTFTMPTDLLDAAQAQIRQEVDLVQKFFPGATMGEMGRLARAGQAAIPAEAAETTVAAAQRLQRFIRARGGIRLDGEELAGELRAVASRAETGARGLVKGRAGISLQAMAQKAAEAQLIPDADKMTLLRALEGATAPAAQQVQVDALGDFFARSAGQLPTMPGEISFQEAQGLLTWLGQRVRSLQRATTPDAGEQLGAAKLLYSRLQATIDRAAESSEISAEARVALKTANAAYKVKATVDSLEDALERFITDGKLNAAGLLDYLRKNAEGGFLATRLKDIGHLDDLTAFLMATNQQYKDLATQGASRRLATAQQTRQVRGTMRQEAVATEQAKEQARQTLAQQETGITQRTGAREAALLEQQEQAAQATQQAVRQSRLQERTLRRTQQQGERATQRTLAAEKQAVPPRPGKPSLYIGGAGIGAAVLYDPVLGTAIAAPVVLARALMTKPGQRLVRRLLQQSGGVIDAPMLRLLASTVLRESTRQAAEAP